MGGELGGLAGGRARRQAGHTQFCCSDAMLLPRQAHLLCSRCRWLTLLQGGTHSDVWLQLAVLAAAHLNCAAALQAMPGASGRGRQAYLWVAGAAVVTGTASPCSRVRPGQPQAAVQRQWETPAGMLQGRQGAVQGHHGKSSCRLTVAAAASVGLSECPSLLSALRSGAWCACCE